MLVLPTITAPAARSRATTGASCCGRLRVVERPGARQRRLAGDVAQVLDRDRDAGERPRHHPRLAQRVAGIGRGERLLLVDLDEGPRAFARGILDAAERLFGELARGGAAGREVGRKLLDGRVHLPLFFTRSSTTGGIGEGRGVAEVAEIVLGDLAQDAAHDLARAGLGQAGRPLDHVGRGDRADLLAHPAVAAPCAAPRSASAPALSVT